jgi:exonuclease III
MKKEASQEKGDKKQVGVAILMSNKIDSQQKLIKKKKNKKEHFICIKVNIQQASLSILNIYAPNARAPIFVREILLKLKSYIPNTNSEKWQYTTLTKQVIKT